MDWILGKTLALILSNVSIATLWHSQDILKNVHRYGSDSYFGYVFQNCISFSSETYQFLLVIETWKQIILPYIWWTFRLNVPEICPCINKFVWSRISHYVQSREKKLKKKFSTLSLLIHDDLFIIIFQENLLRNLSFKNARVS